MGRLVELNHVVAADMPMYPGLPGPVIGDHLGFDDSHAVYGHETEFQIGRVEMVSNTGTYLDTPAHRFRDGFDLAGLPLAACADVPGVVVPVPDGVRGIGVRELAPHDLAGRAVLLRTGWDRHWGTAAYTAAERHPYLTADGAGHLLEAGARLVGIDSLNVDDTSAAAQGLRPAHTELLRAGVPIVEHLCDLAELGEAAFRFFAVPVRVRGMGTFPTRAFAIVDD